MKRFPTRFETQLKQQAEPTKTKKRMRKKKMIGEMDRKKRKSAYQLFLTENKKMVEQVGSYNVG